MKQRCANCASDRRSVYRKRLCGRCYSAAQKLARIEAWNLSKPESLVGYPTYDGWRTPEYFAVIKRGAHSQAHARLEELKAWEKMWESGAFGIVIEHMLRRLSRRAGCRKEVHYGAATRIDHSFRPDEKRELLRLLLEIEEELPWRGIDISRILSDYERTFNRKG